MTKAENINPDGLFELIHAILRQAARDYENALRKKKQFTTDHRQFTEVELERWFLSPYGQTLSCGSGQRIIEQCRRNAKQKEAKRKKWAE